MRLGVLTVDWLSSLTDFMIKVSIFFKVSLRTTDFNNKRVSWEFSSILNLHNYGIHLNTTVKYFRLSSFESRLVDPDNILFFIKKK